MTQMKKEREQFAKESKYTRAFSVAIVVTVVLSVFIGIIPAIKLWSD
jgi:hypothetical protein